MVATIYLSVAEVGVVLVRHARRKQYVVDVKPAISLPVPLQALIFASNFAGGVHGHQAIVSFLQLVTTVDHGALLWSTLKPCS